MKQKTLSKPTAKDAINSVRGARNKRTAIIDIRSNASPAVISGTAKWGMKWLASLGVIAPAKASSLIQLGNVPSLPHTSIERELAWITSFIVAAADMVNDHVTSTGLLEEALLGHQIEQVENLIGEIEARLGYTFFYTSLRFAVSQFNKGLEAQKDLAAELRENGAARLFRFFVFWWSVRAENETSASHFRERIEERLIEWAIDKGLEAEIRYHILGITPPSGDECLLLASCTSATAIDSYEIFVAVATTCAVERRPAAKSFLPYINLAIDHINDNRLLRVRFLIDGSIISGISSGSGPYMSRYFGSGILQPDDAVPRTISELRYAALLGFEKSRSEFCARLLGSLKGIGNPEESSVHQEAVAKFGLMLGHLPTAAWLRSLAEDYLPEALPFSERSSGTRFVYQKDGLLDAFFCLDTNAAELFQKSLDIDRQGGAVAAAAKILVGAEIGAQDVPLHDVIVGFYKLGHSFLRESNDAVLAASVNCNSFGYIREGVFLELRSLVEIGRVTDALDRAVQILLRSPKIYNWLPLKLIMNVVYCKDINCFPGLIRTPVFFGLSSEIAGVDTQSLTSYTAEDYLLSQNVDRPSLADYSTEDSSYVNYFLERVCTITNMRLFSSFDSERDLEQERIAVCQILSRRLPSRRDEFEGEARALVTSRLVKEALKELQASKISIDEEPLRQVVTRRLREDYNRYQALFASGLVTLDNKYRESLIALIKTGEIHESLYDIPNNEASELFTQLVTKIIYECSYDAEHGLDCYLSLRIRHGTMSGMLRGPLEHEKIVTRRISESGDYRRNTYWGDMADGTDVWSNLHDRLAKFAGDFDAAIKEMTSELIQISRKDKPQGLFEISPNALSVYSLALDIDASSSIDELFRLSLDLFWGLVEASLKRVRSYIDTQLRLKLCDMLRVLELEVRNTPALVPLADAIIRARNELEKALSLVRDWFELPTANASLVFTVHELIAVSVEAIKSFHKDFHPVIDLKTGDIPALKGALQLFSDIFFLIFENVYTHCGTSYPVVRIDCQMEADRLSFHVVNNVAKSKCTPINVSRVDAARSRIESGAYLDDVSREGGTGLPKLAKLVSLKSGEGNLDFQLSQEQSEFMIYFGVRTTLMHSLEESST